jgi:hypothetical protein
LDCSGRPYGSDFDLPPRLVQGGDNLDVGGTDFQPPAPIELNSPLLAQIRGIDSEVCGRLAVGRFGNPKGLQLLKFRAGMAPMNHDSAGQRRRHEHYYQQTNQYRRQHKTSPNVLWPPKTHVKRHIHRFDPAPTPQRLRN